MMLRCERIPALLLVGKQAKGVGSRFRETTPDPFFFSQRHVNRPGAGVKGGGGQQVEKAPDILRRGGPERAALHGGRRAVVGISPLGMRRQRGERKGTRCAVCSVSSRPLLSGELSE